MDCPRRSRTEKGIYSQVVDYRTYLFYKLAVYSVAYFKTGTFLARFALNLTVLILLFTGCVVSVHWSSDMETKLDNFKGASLVLMVATYGINECICRSNIQRLMRYISRCRANPRYALSGEVSIMDKAFNTSEKNIRFYIFLFALNYPSMIVMKPALSALGLIAGESASYKQLPFSWTILPPNNDTFLYITLGYQALSLILCHCLGITVMCVITTVTTQISALFDEVILSIEHIEERAVRMMEIKRLTREESMFVCLRQTIAHHQELVQELESEKPHLENILFVNLLFMSLIMACEAFPLIQPNLTLVAAVRGIVFLMVDIICTFVSYNNMALMSNRNTKVFDALYDSPWYTCGPKYRKAILIGMGFCHRPIIIRAKGFRGFQATRAAFYTAMQSAFNMLTIMRNVL